MEKTERPVALTDTEYSQGENTRIRMTEQILTNNVWKQVAPIARKTKKREAAIAYVSSITHLAFRRGDLLVCDASDVAIQSGATSVKVLEVLIKKGVRIFSNSTLHTKMLVAGRYAVVGSANLSESSASTLSEAALLTSRMQVVHQTRALIESVRAAGTEIDLGFLARIKKLEVRAPRGGKKRSRQKIILGARAWLAVGDELSARVNKRIEKTVKKEVANIVDTSGIEEYEANFWQFPTQSTMKMARENRPGDRVIRVTRIGRSNRYEVTAPQPVIARKVSKGHIRSYFPHEEVLTLSWGDFARGADKAGLSLSRRNQELAPRKLQALAALFR